MLKRMKKLSKVMIAFAIVLMMALTCFSPLVNVIAATYGSGDYHVDIRIDNGIYDVDVIKVNNVAWTSWNKDAVDTFSSNNDVFVIEIFAYKNGDSYPKVSYCGGDCASHYSVQVEPASNVNL